MTEVQTGGVAGAGGADRAASGAPRLRGIAAAPDKGTARAAARAARRAHDAELDELSPRMGGMALKNGLILVSERFWSVAIREADGSISVASGTKTRLPGSGGPQAGAGAGATTGAPGARDARGGAARGGEDTRGAAAQRGAASGGRRGAAVASAGIPLLRGLGRFGETLLVLALVKSKLPNAELPFESGRVAAALGASMVGTSAVRALAPKSAVAQEVGTALAAFIPAVLSLKNSGISGYHGAEHKVIGGREIALREAADADASGAQGAGAGAAGVSGAQTRDQAGGRTGLGAVSPETIVAGDSAAAAKEHDRCGSNIVGPYLLATIATNILARGRKGVKSPAASAAAGAASLGLALEALRWANKHGDSILARLMLSPGRAIQKVLTTSEPTSEQLEVGERALEELLRLEGIGR